MGSKERNMPDGPSPEIQEPISKPKVSSFWETPPPVLAKAIGGKLEFEDGFVKAINKEIKTDHGLDLITINYPQEWGEDLMLDLPGMNPIIIEHAIFKTETDGLPFVVPAANSLSEDCVYGTISCDGRYELFQKDASNEASKEISDLVSEAHDIRSNNLDTGWKNRKRWLADSEDEDPVRRELTDLRIKKKHF